MFCLSAMALTLRWRRHSPKRSMRTVQEAERKFVLELIKHSREPVLDVGTGDCACVASIAARLGTPVVAMDRDPAIVGAARTFLEKEHLDQDVRLIQDDIAASGLSAESFRNIICFNVLHHVPQLEQAMTELHRILAADGRLIISDFDEEGDGFLKRLQRAAHEHFQAVTPHLRPGGRLVLSCEK